MVIGHCLYVFGGLDDEDYLNQLFRLDLEDFSWRQLSTVNAPSARSYGGMVAHGESLVVFGGLGKNFIEEKEKCISPEGAVAIKYDKFGGDFESYWNNSMHEYSTVTGKHPCLTTHTPFHFDKGCGWPD